MKNNGITMGKKRVKILLVVSVFVIVVPSSLAIWYVRKHRDTYTINPVRPKDFPVILIVPEHAQRIDYSSPRDTRRAAHTYAVSYEVNDPYPSEGTYTFVMERLTLNGWRRLEYDLMNPHQPRFPVPLLPQYVDANIAKSYLPKDQKKNLFALENRREDWVNSNDEVITVVLWYYGDLVTGRIYREKVNVNISYFDCKSWIGPYILRYKKVHAEEFNEVTTAPQPEKK